MKIRDILDFSFILCSLGDTLGNVIKKICLKDMSYAIVVDRNNEYVGLLSASTLLKNIQYAEHKIDRFVVSIQSILEHEDIQILKKAEYDIIPVVNMDNNVVGVISIKSVLEYIPGGMGQLGKGYTNQLKAGKNQGAKYTIDDIIGESNAVLTLKERIIAAAKTTSTVLIMGETGTGKELVAHAITNLSARRHQSFVRINCAAIPETLLESELFGYESGAFTGATKGGHPGKFIMANDGTIFLDEIGDMQLPLQSKILRVLQEKEIEKIGGHYPIPIDVRVIAATHADLYELVKDRKFRQDLFYRLHVIPIHIPPLRDRKEDIPLLVDYFINRFTGLLSIRKPSIHQSFINKLMSYHWPGNIRELSNVVEMAVNFTGGMITEEQIPRYIFSQNAFIQQEFDNSNNLRTTTEENEREIILKALEAHRGNKNKVAEMLGISRSNLYYKMKKLNIDAS
ncbi:sigma 54-interacting transcriptional regulator [Anaerosolibacter sp.]|uniref:sigma 54-interacting transcriptional regulator n=1 Tax=Anaerosolibacter sp. TaxID=1872527 RepID=UPI0039EFAA92